MSAPCDIPVSILVLVLAELRSSILLFFGASFTSHWMVCVQLDDGTINWGFILFLLLAAAVLSLWFHICRSAGRLFRVHRAEAAQFLSSAQAPLLSEWRAAIAPLAPEKPVAQAAALEIFSAVEVRITYAPCCAWFHFHMLCKGPPIEWSRMAAVSKEIAAHL